MKRPLMRDTRNWPNRSEEARETPSAWKKVLPVASWVMVLAAMGVAAYGSGLGARAAAAGARGGPDHQSEAALGTSRRQDRQRGCTLIVPDNALTAQGLATPYQMSGPNCDESTPTVAAFVQATVLDPATGQVSVYNPLVINKGTKPAATPVVPTLPANAVVGIWFGSNANGLHLRGAQGTTLANANCVDGLNRSIFGQVAYCNAPAFFTQANQLIQAGKLVPPPLGVAKDGMTCPTVRDFSVVDQDQSDNVTTTYLVTQDGKMAQNTATNAIALANSTVIANGSDNRLVAIALDKALGCQPWTAPDLANPGQMVTAQPLDELQAAMYQAAPVALVPSRDPMTLVNGQPSLDKQNLYRAGVDQPAVASAAQAKTDQTAYCQSLLNVAPARLQLDRQFTQVAASPDPAVANNLFTFLAARFAFTFGQDGLNCTGILHVRNPVQLQQDNDGITVDATFTTVNGQNQAGSASAMRHTRAGA